VLDQAIPNQLSQLGADSRLSQVQGFGELADSLWLRAHARKDGQLRNAKGRV
jgi:hypothetical protein